MSDFSRRAFVASAIGAVGAAGIATAVPAVPAEAASADRPRLAGNTDSYLQATGVTGDSVTRGYENWVPIGSWSWASSGGARSKGGAATPPVCGPFLFSALAGRQTPTLTSFLVTAKVIKAITVVTLVDTGAGQAEALKVSLTDAIIDSFTQVEGATGPVEEWSVSAFSQLRFESRTRNARGTFNPWETVTWNNPTNP